MNKERLMIKKGCCWRGSKIRGEGKKKGEEEKEEEDLVNMCGKILVGGRKWESGRDGRAFLFMKLNHAATSNYQGLAEEEGE